MDDLVTLAVMILVSVLTSTGVVTVIVKFYVESALKSAQEKHRVKVERNHERYKLDDEWKRQVGRAFYWTHRGILAFEKETSKGFWNGELADALKQIDEIEAKKKDIDREQLAELNEL